MESKEAGGGVGMIPQSTALDEVVPDSLGELVNVDVEKYGRGHRDKIVRALREQRKRWEISEKEGPPRRKKGEKVGAGTEISGDEDLGL